jgi:hypothetical protein
VEADTLEELRSMVRDAVECHFEADDRPKVVRLVAAGRGEETNRVVVPDPWQRISRSASDERKRT